jgi:RluA family pseudouridine synthase
MTPDQLLARLLYRDGLMLIIDKPAGLPVHEGRRDGAHLGLYLHALRFGLPRAPELAHRLDQDTSGCLVLGRHRKALAKLGRLFAEGKVEKTYWAVVEGAPPQAAGRIDLPLRKHTPRHGWRMVVDHKQGQSAITDYRVLGNALDLTWLELKPQTGRTHQLRAHCEALGCPILGDPVYGKQPSARPGATLHLHARSIAVPLYPRRAPIIVTAPVPPHMLKTLRACGFDPRSDAGLAPVIEAAPAG